MNPFTTTEQHAAISVEERQRRLDAFPDAIASATIEGGSVGPETQAIMKEWAKGLITEEQAIEHIKAFHIARLKLSTAAGN